MDGALRSRRATAPTGTCMSIRSESGPDIRAEYLATSVGAHTQRLPGSPALPQGHRCVAFLPFDAKWREAKGLRIQR